MPVYDDQVVDPSTVVPNEGPPMAEGVKLWRRDWDAMPDRAQVRFYDPDGSLGVDIGYWAYAEPEGGWIVDGPWPAGSHLLGWYWLANPESDAAYDPDGGSEGSPRGPGKGTG